MKIDQNRTPSSNARAENARKYVDDRWGISSSTVSYGVRLELDQIPWLSLMDSHPRKRSN